MANIEINAIRVINFNPRDSTADIEASFTKNGIQEKVTENSLLRNPEKILRNLFLKIKSKNKLLFDDPTLSPVELLDKYSPIIIQNEEQTEEKIFNFLRTVCEKSKRLKNTKEAREHVVLLDYIKTSCLKL